MHPKHHSRLSLQSIKMYCKLFCLFVLVAGVHSRYLLIEEPGYYVEEYEGQAEPWSSTRVRRQVGAFTMNSDGTSNAMVKVPITGNDQHKLSALGSVDINDRMKLGAATAGLAYDNVNRHGATLTNTHIPGFGDKLTAAGKLNLFHNDNHNLNANAFATKNMPNIPHVPDFHTYGGGVDYMFKDKIGASASAAHTDLFNRNDYSLGGKLNLFKSPDTSVDFNAGWKKFEMPNFKSNWEPSTGFSFTKFF